MWLIVVIGIVLPLFLMGMVALVRQPNKTLFGLFALAMGLGVLFCWLVFPWHIVSLWLRAALPFLYVACVFIGMRRVQVPQEATKPWIAWLNGVINVVVLVFMAGLCWNAVKGYRTPVGAIALELPLRDARYVVGQGGASVMVNGHFRVKPQNYALDIVGLNGWGTRAVPFGDRYDLDSYDIMGAMIYSPCDGRVLSSVDGLIDQPIGGSDRENLAGNHVLLDCDEAEVVLAHMKQHSVLVKAGQNVEAGDPLGRVGNSGNTSEPHLHIHVERGGEHGRLLNGEAVPMTFGGRFLVRGDIIGPVDDE